MPCCERLDAALVRRGLAGGREKAKGYIRAGQVTVNGVVALKPSAEVAEEDDIACAAVEKYVGRGGLKLEKALEGLDVAGTTALDVGASTGGFTDCLLRHGAAKVFAVDVGHGQLHPSLRADPRVVSLEGRDIRDAALRDILPAGGIDVCVIDVAFISLTKIVFSLPVYMRPGAVLAALVKPQFEAGRGAAGKNGVVSDPAVHARVLTEVTDAFRECGFQAVNILWSPVTGGDGNIEYLLSLRYNKTGSIGSTDSVSSISSAEWTGDINRLVDDARRHFHG